MAIQDGDILRCKKNWYLRNDCCCYVGEHFVVGDLDGGDYKQIQSVRLYNVNNSYVNIAFRPVNENLSSDLRYLWDHFENKYSRAKRIIKKYGFKDR